MTEVEKYYNLNDPSKKGPRGFVFAYDENGKLLFTEENMIVKTGRAALMKYGFDTNSSKITKVLIGDSENVTKNIDDTSSMGTTIRTINHRISDMISENEEKNYEIDTTNYDICSKNMNMFKTLSIKSSDCSIYYYLTDENGNVALDENDNKIEKTIIHNREDTDTTDDNVLGVGFDGSCFDIKQDDTNGLYALVKIFIRQSYEDTEAKTGSSAEVQIATDQISCLGLCMGDTLFSRLVFPKYYKSSSQAIVFDYYIYF